MALGDSSWVYGNDAIEIKANHWGEGYELQIFSVGGSRGIHYFIPRGNLKEISELPVGELESRLEAINPAPIRDFVKGFDFAKLSEALKKAADYEEERKKFNAKMRWLAEDAVGETR